MRNLTKSFGANMVAFSGSASTGGYNLLNAYAFSTNSSKSSFSYHPYRGKGTIGLLRKFTQKGNLKIVDFKHDYVKETINNSKIDINIKTRIIYNLILLDTLNYMRKDTSRYSTHCVDISQEGRHITRV